MQKTKSYSHGKWQGAWLLLAQTYNVNLHPHFEVYFLLVDVCRTLTSRLWQISLIFYSAPVVRFLGKNIHFTLFVLLYTYVGITLQPDHYRWEEGVMHFWIISLFFIEIRQLSENGWSRWENNCLAQQNLF
jgi:hypothetical protein